MKYIGFLCSLLLALCFAGCVNLKPKQDVSREFVLGPIAMKESAQLATHGLYVERVDMPAYLSENALQYLAADGELISIRNARWAEPLNIGVGRTLFQLIASSSSTEGGYYPWPNRAKTVPVLQLRFGEFGAARAGFIRMSGSWQIRSASRKIVSQGSFKLVDISWDVDSPESLVKGLNQGLSQIANEIRQRLTK